MKSTQRPCHKRPSSAILTFLGCDFAPLILSSKLKKLKRLRILQIFSRYLQSGGEENSVYRIGDTLQADHDVEYFIGSTQELMGHSLSDRISAPFRAFANLPIRQRLLKYQALGHFDLWLIHNVLPGLSPSVYTTAFSLGIPVVHYLHNYRMGCINGFFLNHGQPCERCISGNFWPAFQTACWHDSHLISGWMGLVTQRIRHLHVFSKVCAWIALSESQRIKHEQMGIPASRLHVIPHFYQPKESPPPPCPNGNVLFLGRLSPEKGVDLLLHAWKSVSPKGRKLVIAGDGPESDKLKVLATSLNLKNVEFVGYLNPERQRAIWAESAFSVIPSIWREPFGLVLLEAWAQARPCVAFRAGALEELIHHGVDGLLADPLSPASLGKQIQFLIDRPSPCVSMGEAGRNRILTEFAPATWNQKMKHVLQKTLPSSALHDS